MGPDQLAALEKFLEVPAADLERIVNPRTFEDNAPPQAYPVKWRALDWAAIEAGRPFVWIENYITDEDRRVLEQRGLLDCFVHCDVTAEPHRLPQVRRLLEARFRLPSLVALPLGLLTHRVHRHEITLDERYQVERFAGHLHLTLSIHLHCVDGWQAAHGHGPKGVHVQVAEVKPVGPRLVEGRVEPADFGHHVNLSRVVVPPLDAEHEVVQPNRSRCG